MKRNLCGAMAMVFLSLSVFCACKDIVVPDGGKRMSKVVYQMDLIQENGDTQYDYQYKNQSKAVFLPAAVSDESRVSPVKPVRRGYEFQYWTDGVNQYQPGDLFNEDTVILEDGSVILTAVFEKPSVDDETKIIPALDEKYWKESKETMFEVTASELVDVGLRGHANNRQLGSLLTEEADPIDVSFINFPGGYIWDVNHFPKQTETQNVTNWHKEVVGLNEGPIGATPVVEDFALAETEVTGGLFHVVKKWNDDNNKGYNIVNSSEPNGATVTESNKFLSGVYYLSSTDNKQVGDRQSAYDPIVRITYKESIVFCNMLTQWYNEVKRPEDAPLLTFAYTKDGKSVGSDASSLNLIKNINDPELLLIGPREVYNSNAKFNFSHVQGATGFRLPTAAEWIFAATVNPENDTTNYGAGPYPTTYKFPSIIDSSFVVGGKEKPATNDITRQYAVLNSEYYYNNTHSTKDFGSAAVKTKKASATGLYDMTGNVWEFASGRSFVNSSSYTETHRVLVRLYGASYSSSESYSCLTFFTGIDVGSRADAYGFRVCRTTASYPVIL